MTTIELNLRNPELTETEKKLAEAILAEISATAEGEQAVSFLLADLRANRWKNLPNQRIFEQFCEKAGFTLRKTYTKAGYHKATYVTL